MQVRTITLEARRVGWFGTADGSIIHDMRVTLRVRYPDLVITGVAAEMVSRPYTLCMDAIEPLPQLVGLSVAQGFTRAVTKEPRAGIRPGRASVGRSARC